jgi:tetratricopeptide (TPR) repeat protein
MLLGLILALKGEVESELSLKRALRIHTAQYNRAGECIDNLFLTQKALLFGEIARALYFANRAWEIAYAIKDAGSYIQAACRQGEAALESSDFTIANKQLNEALTHSRLANRVEVELPALVALATLRQREGDWQAARDFLDDVWDLAERGPHILIQADAYNVLAQIERDEGNRERAIEAATKAYRLAWCDGPPFAYHWGLVAASKHLEDLGVPKPEMPPFDESKFEPMPEVEIDPEDEFHVGKS